MPAPKGHAPYPGCETGGRPKIWNADKIDELTASLEDWFEEAHRDKKSFWWHDWCFDNNLQPSRVAELAREFEKFNAVYKKVKDWQESIIVKGALTKKLSDGFSKFYLCNHYSHNWKDKGVDERDKIPPQDSLVELDNENMSLKAKLRKLENDLDMMRTLVNQPKTG